MLRRTLSRRDQPLCDLSTNGPSPSIDIDAGMDVYVYTIVNRPEVKKGGVTFQILVSLFPPVILSLPYPLARTTHLYIVHNIK